MKEEGGVKALYRGLVPTSAGACTLPPPCSQPVSSLTELYHNTGVAPYVAFNLRHTSSSSCRSAGSTRNIARPTRSRSSCAAESREVSHRQCVPLRLPICSCLAASDALLRSRCDQLTYPADLLRRRMQMVGLKSQALGYQYQGAWDGTLELKWDHGNSPRKGTAARFPLRRSSLRSFAQSARDN